MEKLSKSESIRQRHAAPPKANPVKMNNFCCTNFLFVFFRGLEMLSRPVIGHLAQTLSDTISLNFSLKVCLSGFVELKSQDIDIDLVKIHVLK